MAERKTLAGIIPELQKKIKDLPPQKANEINKIIKAIQEASDKVFTFQENPNKPPSGGGTMYSSSDNFPGTNQKISVITKNGAPTPSALLSEDDFNNLIEEIAPLIAQNGAEAAKPTKTRKPYIMNKFEKILTTSFCALMIAGAICLGITAIFNHNQHTETLNRMETKIELQNSNYKNQLGDHLENMEANYNALLNSYAILQGSAELDNINAMVKESTGHPTLTSYLDFVHQELGIAKEFHDNTPNIDNGSNTLFEKVATEINLTNTTLSQIRQESFRVLAQATKAPTIQTEMDMGMGE